MAHMTVHTHGSASNTWIVLGKSGFIAAFGPAEQIIGRDVAGYLVP
jgi:hypothetical protein